MFVKVARVKRKNKVYQYAQLVESFRRPDGMVTQRVLASLGQRTDLEIANLRKALDASREGAEVMVRAADTTADPAQVLDNLVWLNVAVVIQTLRKLGVDAILEQVLPREGAEVADADIVLALVAQRCVDPDSKRAAVNWFGRTALPELLGVPMSRFNNTRLHRVMAGLEAVEEALQERLASAVDAHCGGFSLLFLDVTDTWFVGRGPPLATAGKTKEGLYRRKVGIALLCDEVGHPLRWQVIQGNRHDSGPMTDAFRSLEGVDWARGVPLVLDRAMGATAHIVELLAADRPFITALTRNEFDAYTDDLPCSQLLGLASTTPDVEHEAAAMVVGAGMERVSDDLYVRDLGVVTRKVPEPLRRAPPVAGADKCRERLAVARAIQVALDSGEIGTLTEAAQQHGISVPTVSQTMTLLRLAADLQERVAAGDASALTLKELRQLATDGDLDGQRRDFDAALKAACSQPDGRRARDTGKRNSVGTAAEVGLEPPQIRAVLAFNPQMWLRQKQSRDALLAELVAWAGRQNQTRRRGRPRSAAKLREAAAARLARHSLTRACTVDVRTERIDGRDVPQVRIAPKPDTWQRRQRFFGWQVIVARPDDRRPAADLVRVYRSKDQVEKDFQTIKSVLSLRPVRHRTDVKLRAHVTLCMLALLVERVLDQALGKRCTGVAALDTLSDIHLNRLKTGADPLPVYTITRPKAEHMEILRALDLEHLVDDARMTASLRAR